MKKMKLFKKMLAGILAGAMCCSMSIGAFAAENVWHGDEVSVPITAGSNGYTFRSVYLEPHHAYEMSNHMVSVDGGANNDIPQTLVMVEADKNYPWTPEGVYSFGNSNYEVLYCCDAETGYYDNIYYRRTNLEDSNYYTDEEAAHIRAIVTNSYPYVSLDEMKEDLKKGGFADAEKLTRAEIITAVQAAIWAYANVGAGDYVYSQTFNVPDNPQWGGVMHDYTNEMDVWWKTGKRVFSTDVTVANRINSLIDYLKGLDPVSVTDDQVIISDIKVLGTVPVEGKDDFYNVDLKVLLNNSGSGTDDNINLEVFVDGKSVKKEKINYGIEEYELSVQARQNQTIKAVVSGTQILPEGVYFYEPEGGRHISQCLVGVAAGETDVYAEASVALFDRIINFKKTTTTEEGTKPLEGIEFDIYFAGTIETYSKFVEDYVADEANAEMLKGKTAAEIAKMAQKAFAIAKAADVTSLRHEGTVVTDVTGKASYNITNAHRNDVDFYLENYDGVYLIVEKAHPAVVDPLAPFVVAVPMTAVKGSGLLYEVDIEPKNEMIPPEICKDVIAIDKNEASVNVGDAFTWIVRGEVPADMAGAKKYMIIDTLDHRLTYVKDQTLVVKVEAKGATADNSANGNNVLKLDTNANDKNYNDYYLSVGNAFVDVSGGDAVQTTKIAVTLTEAGITKVAELAKKIGGECEVRVYFDTVVDEDAVVGEEIPNQATLLYTNSANFDFKVESDKPIVYTCGVNIYKYDAKNVDTPLSGAEFTLAREATEADRADKNTKIDNLVIARGSVKEVVFVKFYDNAELVGEKVEAVTTNTTGDALMYGLEEGTYYLVETKAPEGYNLLSYPVEVIVNRDSHETVDNPATEDVNEDMTIRVANSNRFELPSTGGIGTTIFTLVGAALTLGSGAVLAGKKRKEESEE